MHGTVDLGVSPSRRRVPRSSGMASFARWSDPEARILLRLKAPSLQGVTRRHVYAGGLEI